MQPRQRRVHAVVNGCALCRVRIRHLRLPEHAAVGEAHDIEGGAGNGIVRAIDEGLRYRKALCVQGGDDPKFPIHRMSGGQQLAGRLAPQHIAAARRFEEIGRVRLATAELRNRKRASEVRDAFGKIVGKPRRIDRQSRRDLLGS